MTQFQLNCGLEVHIQLNTRSKIFCSDATAFGKEPNTQISEISLAYPGVLPVLNKQVIEHSIKLGLATNCTIQSFSSFDRKNYFYPDLPKGYQITQDKFPICTEGFIRIKGESFDKKIRIQRIHIEEDAGKSIHDMEDNFTCIDLNRAGTPLLEMVTYPDIESSDEAYAFFSEVRKIVKWINVCDGNMEEGSLRCDANISVRFASEEKLGTRCEIKNINSVRYLKMAVEYESERQKKLISQGEKIVQETRGFDANTGSTFSQRSKEDAHDYRYFPDPDLPAILVSEAQIQQVKETMPELPHEVFAQCISTFHLSEYESEKLSEDYFVWLYFKQCAEHTSNYKAIANWILNTLKAYCNAQKMEFTALTFSPGRLVDMINTIDTGIINLNVAQQKLFPYLIIHNESTVSQAVQKLELAQSNDEIEVERIIDAVLDEMHEKVTEYKKGKKGLLALFVGETMKRTKGKANPQIVNKILLSKLA